MGQSWDRLLHAKGMRASLRLLLEDSRLNDAAVVQDHYDRCNAMVEMLEQAETPSRGRSDA